MLMFEDTSKNIQLENGLHGWIQHLLLAMCHLLCEIIADDIPMLNLCFNIFSYKKYNILDQQNKINASQQLN